MAEYLAKQLVASALVLFLVMTATFFLVKMAPGQLSILADPTMDPAVVASVEKRFGLDRPPFEQYLRWVSRMSQGDLGTSLVYGRPVLAMVTERLPATLLLGLVALSITVLIGIPAGIIAARWPNSMVDQALSFVGIVGLATPNFWLGILLIILFSVKLGWLPGSGMQTIGQPFSLLDRASYLVLPAIVLATSTTAEIMRYTRSSWLEVMNQDYVRTARSKGLAEPRVHLKHVFKNALIPVLTILGLALPRLVGGSAIVESLFSWPGIGSMAVNAAVSRDATVILGTTLFVSAGVIASNLLIDVLYGVVDPRIRYD
ncbi:MAG: ABC transporter permease [Trueperaceae bacterium]|nr:ABC transporter permease [Trueperaceae bacterium]